MGGHPAFSFAGYFLLFGGPSGYGSGIESIEFYRIFQAHTETQVLRSFTLASTSASANYPNPGSKRKLRRIEVASTANSVLKKSLSVNAGFKFPLAYSLVHVARSYHRSALSIATLSRQDDIHWTELKSHFNGRLEQLPKTEIELQTTLQELRLEDEKRLLP